MKRFVTFGALAFLVAVAISAPEPPAVSVSPECHAISKGVMECRYPDGFVVYEVSTRGTPGIVDTGFPQGMRP